MFSIKRFAEEKNDQSKIPKEVKELSKWVSEVVSSSFSGQLNVAGLGGGFGSSKSYKSISEISVNVLQNKIQQVVEQIKNIFKIDGIFLNINNVGGSRF